MKTLLGFPVVELEMPDLGERVCALFGRPLLELTTYPDGTQSIRLRNQREIVVLKAPPERE